jgi:hypothetical protein
MILLSILLEHNEGKSKIPLSYRLIAIDINRSDDIVSKKLNEIVENIISVYSNAHEYKTPLEIKNHVRLGKHNLDKEINTNHLNNYYEIEYIIYDNYICLKLKVGIKYNDEYRSVLIGERNLYKDFILLLNNLVNASAFIWEQAEEYIYRIILTIHEELAYKEYMQIRTKTKRLYSIVESMYKMVNQTDEKGKLTYVDHSDIYPILLTIKNMLYWDVTNKRVTVSNLAIAKAVYIYADKNEGKIYIDIDDRKKPSNRYSICVNIKELDQRFV